MTWRFGVAAIACLAVAAGCSQKVSRSDAAAASTPAEAALQPPPPPKPERPFSFAQTTADAEVKLSLPPAIARWPALHRQLYDREIRDLKAFVAAAATDRSDVTSSDYQPPIYARDLAWGVTGATPRLVSLRQDWYESTGGAHPNHGSRPLLWDVTAKRPLAPAALFIGGDLPALQTALCEGLRAAKVAKGLGDDWDPARCPKWREAKLVLAPSTTAGKFGGVTFLFDPYDVGAYVEGDYEVTLPLSAVGAALAPAWASEFAGAPKPQPKPRE